MLYIYYAVLFVAIVLGLLLGMALYRWFHYRDICEVGELLIGEEDSPDWPYLSLSLDEEVKNFEGDKYIMLRVHKLDLTRENMVLNGGNSNYFVKEKIKMENYENKELLKEAAKQSLESLKDLKPGTEEYTNTAKMALQLYDMQLKSDEQESNQNLKEDEERRKGQEVINDQEKAAKARHIEWAKFGISCLTFLGTIGTTVYWSICEAGGVAPLSRAMNDGLHEIKRGFTDRK